MKHTYIIAEAGVNHNGNVDLALKMIEIAAQCGADAIKFQTFNAKKGIISNAPKAEYQIVNTNNSESQLDMVKKLEIDEKSHYILYNFAAKSNIEFLSTGFDFESVELLDKLGLQTFKVGSGEIINLPLLRKIGKLGKKVILSTGMSDLGEIEDAIDILIASGTSRNDITVLHCNTEYPTPYKDVNLNAMLTIKNAFGVNVGYSDHTKGIEISIAAAAMGAMIIEKHFTLDKNMEGPDHKASIEPHELKQLVESIRNVDIALGDGIKKPSESESKNIKIARKSLYAACPIKKGEIFTEENVGIKRPGVGISPLKWDEIIGTLATHDYKEDELI